MTDSGKNLFPRCDSLVGLVLLRLQRLAGKQSSLPVRVARAIRPKLGEALPLEGGRPQSPLEVVVWQEDAPLVVVVPQAQLERLAVALDELQA